MPLTRGNLRFSHEGTRRTDPDIDGVNIYGRVIGVRGLMVEIAGQFTRCRWAPGSSSRPAATVSIPSEVIGLPGNNAVVMPFAGLEGVRRGSCCHRQRGKSGAAVAIWLVESSCDGRAIDGKGPLPQAPRRCPTATRRRRHIRPAGRPPLDLGVRALNTFLTCCRGQRLGIFAGSASASRCFVHAGAQCGRRYHGHRLVGERGREVQEFLQDDLGDEGLRGRWWWWPPRTSRLMRGKRPI